MGRSGRAIKSWVGLVAVTGLTAAWPASALAGSRIAPVAATCPPDRPQRVVDASGEDDRCVAREDPKCAPATALRIDAKGEADVCAGADPAAGPSASKTKAPKCRGGFRLQVGTAKDVCEKAGPPLCPSDAILKTIQGEDQCRY
jgi:hypothetical protein